MPLFGFAPEIGEKAPKFSLPDQNGKFRNMEEFIGNRLVIYFFPKADTPGWTKQACGFRDESEKYKKLGINIIGISYDSPKSLAAFKEKYDIPFDFLSDRDKEIGKKYGVNRFLFTARKTFLIDEKGILIDIIHSVNLHTHADDIISLFELNKHKRGEIWIFQLNTVLHETIYRKPPVWRQRLKKPFLIVKLNLYQVVVEFLRSKLMMILFFQKKL